MALTELEHWLAEAERIKALHEQRIAAQLALIDAEAAVAEHEARVAATEQVSIGKNADTRAALLKELLSHDGDYRHLGEEVVTKKKRAAEAEGALEAQRTKLALVKAWWGKGATGETV